MKRAAFFASCLVAAVIAAVIIVPIAIAHTGSATINCTNVHFSFANFSSGGTRIINETVSVDGNVVHSGQFTFSGSSGSNDVAINVPGGTHDVTAHADWTAEGGGQVNVTQQVSCGSPPPPPCPSGKKVNFRWHYSANGSSGSWSATKGTPCPGSVSIGPQAMGGDLKVAPGQTLKVGYSFTLPGNKDTLSLTVNNPTVVFTLRCASGATPSAATLSVPMATATFSVTDDAWYPSGDQHSPLVYQGSATVPDVCGGGNVRFDKGGTFTASVS